MAYYKTFIIFCISILIRAVYSESNCGTTLCVSTNTIKPNSPVKLSWHKSDNPNGLQISLLYGDNSDKTDCHELQGQPVLRSWRLNHGEEEYEITINEVDFEIENKKFVFLVDYLTSNYCMMAPAGPKGLGTSYVVFDPSMPVNIPSNNNGDNSQDNNNNANGDNVNDDNDNDTKNNGSNGDNDNLPGDSDNIGNGKNGNGNNGKNPQKDDKVNDDSKKPSSFLKILTILLSIIIGVLLVLLIIYLIVFCLKKTKEKDKNSNVDSMKQNSTTRILSPNLDDAFNEESVYSAVKVNNALSKHSNENFIPNLSVESFNSSTSQSGLISRHEAKMIAERFRCELQNPLNNEADDASSIKGKENSV